MGNPLHSEPRPWSVVLAGGEGQRIRPFIEQWLGFHKPKQFCSFVGSRTMLQHTWDRADQLTLRDRKVTVVSRDHRHHLRDHLELPNGGRMLFQPSNRDTAAGIFLPLSYIRKWDPHATVVVYPSDHFVYPEHRFTDMVRRAISSAERLTDRIILVGVQPTHLELEYGWVHPGQALGWSGGSKVHEVEAFAEKPSMTEGIRALRAGALWNTFIFCAKVETLWDLGYEAFPDLMGCFDEFHRAIGKSQEGMVLEAVYKVMPRYNFSSDLLQKFPKKIGVMELRHVLWSDWGQPHRIMEMLQAIGKQAAFPVELLANYRSASDQGEKTGTSNFPIHTRLIRHLSKAGFS